MSSSDWGAVFAFVGVTIVALSATFLFSDWVSSRGLFHYHNAKINQGKTRDQYCNGPSVESTKSPQNRSSTDQEKAYDLCQQWRMARAAEDAAYSARQQALVAFASLVVLFVATAFAGAAAFYARQAAVAGNGMIAEAKETNKTAREIGETQARAHLTVLNPRYTFEDGACAVVFDLHNIGNSAAKNVVAVCWFYISSLHGPAEKLIGGGMGTGTLRQGDSLDGMKLSCQGCFHARRTDDQVVLMQVHLFVNFVDAFGKNHEWQVRYLAGIEGEPPNWKPGTLIEPAPYTLTEVERCAEEHALGSDIEAAPPSPDVR
jgi:hypothetical protein